MRKIAALTVLCLFAVCLLLPFGVGAATVDIHDDAKLFTSAEKVEIQKQLDKFHEKFPDLDLLVATTGNAQGLSARAYAIDLYERLGYSDDGAMVLIDMDNRECYILTVGVMRDYVDKHIETMLDRIFKYLPDGDYGNSAVQFVKDAYRYTRNARGISPVEYAIMFGVPVLVFLVGVFSVKFRYGHHSTKNEYPLSERSNLELTYHEDRLVNVTHRTRVIESSSGSSGGGGGGGGGGGRSYGGGGRSF